MVCRRLILVLIVAGLSWIQVCSSSPRALSSHILDTKVGRPAGNVTISVFRLNSYGEWKLQDSCVTDMDGRCGNLLDQNCFSRGLYMMYFETGPYFRRTNTATFYPYVEVVFEIKDSSQHYHIALLLNPFSYTTYRGS